MSEYKNRDQNKNKKKTARLCEVSKKCGGCQYTDMPYKEQLIRNRGRQRGC